MELLSTITLSILVMWLIGVPITMFLCREHIRWNDNRDLWISTITAFFWPFILAATIWSMIRGE